MEFLILTHRESDGFLTMSAADIYLCMEDGAEKKIAQIRDVDYEADGRETTITYGNEELTFYAAYDGPIFAAEDLWFAFRKGEEIAGKLHFYIPTHRICLEYEGRNILVHCTAGWKTVQPPQVDFAPDPEWGRGCAEGRPSVAFHAVSLVGDEKRYQVAVQGALPLPLLFMIFSLIYTASLC